MKESKVPLTALEPTIHSDAAVFPKSSVPIHLYMVSERHLIYMTVLHAVLNFSNHKSAKYKQEIL